MSDDKPRADVPMPRKSQVVGTDDVLQELVTRLQDKGWKAEWWHSGGGIFGILVQLDNGFEVFFGTADEPWMGYDLNTPDGTRVKQFGSYDTTDDRFELRWTHTSARNALPWVIERLDLMAGISDATDLVLE